MDDGRLIETPRLVLRPFALSDAGDVQRLAGDKAIASTTLNIPHPYEDGMAEEWIGTQQEKYENGQQANFAITLRPAGTLIGAVGLAIERPHAMAELGYWIGKPYWNQGYCSEAARAVVEYGFETLELNRVYAHHLKRNPASGRVMRKIGMRHEGCCRQHAKKRDVFEDIELYGVLTSDAEPGVGERKQ